MLMFRPLLRPRPRRIRIFASLRIPRRVAFQGRKGEVVMGAPPTAVASIRLDSKDGMLLDTGDHLRCLGRFASAVHDIGLDKRTHFRMTGSTSHPFVIYARRLRAQMLKAIFSIGTCPHCSPSIVLCRKQIGMDRAGHHRDQRVRPKRRVSLSGRKGLRLGEISARGEGK